MSLTAIASASVTGVSALFCFIAYGTLGWTYQWAELEGVCTTDYKVFIGLYKTRTELDVDCDAYSYSEDDISNNDCDDLSGDQCDLLEGSQSSAGTAVAALVLLIFAQILLLVFGRGDRKFVTMILNITSAVIAAIGAITAFTACGNWKDLTDDINEDLDDEWDVEVGYSWYLMLFSGLFSLGVAAIAAIMLFTQKRLSEGEEPLNKA